METYESCCWCDRCGSELELFDLCMWEMSNIKYKFRGKCIRNNLVTPAAADRYALIQESKWKVLWWWWWCDKINIKSFFLRESFPCKILLQAFQISSHKTIPFPSKQPICSPWNCSELSLESSIFSMWWEILRNRSAASAQSLQQSFKYMDLNTKAKRIKK